MERCLTVIRKRLLLEQLLTVCHLVSSEGNLKIYEKSMLLILHLDLEHTVMYSYRFKQYIQVMLGIFGSPVRMNEKLRSLNLIHSVCKSHQEYKVVAGLKLKLVEKLLKEIKDRVKEDAIDLPVVTKIWSILWTLTDDVPCNCGLFVQNEGLQFSKSYIDKYPDNKALHRVITGTLIAVSENPGLIAELMTSDMVSMFRQLLAYESEEDPNVSSHAVDFLIMLASNSPEAWTVMEPSRDEILEELDQVMHNWDVDKRLRGTFRSLNTILSQLDNYSTPVAQYWAAWLICNLVIVTPKRYCEMLESGDGMAKIDSVLQHGGLRDDIVTLLEKIKSLTMDYKEQRANKYTNN